MNPRGASLATTSIAGYSASDIVCSTRSIDKNLLLLNEKGYLNGHTPFSAVLAFTTLLVASLYGCNEIALSNESSANEPNLPGTRINHQYSKSFEFENDFREYVSNYIDPSIAYYSFLRPLNELQIGGLFSDLVEHHLSFRSCNVGSKTDSWCGHCPKCLFTFIILSPFISYNELVTIFGKDLLDDTSLINTLDQLSGIAKEKPFECVGTIDEVNLAMQLLVRKSPEEKPALLLHYIEKHGVDQKNLNKTMERSMHQFDENNITSSEDVSLLKKKLHDIRY
jgi:hypothetical protein